MPEPAGDLAPVARAGGPATADGAGGEPERVRVPPGRIAAVAARPGFLLGHLVVAALAVTTILLGRWQWHVAHVHASSLQNYAYAFQWWIFCAFGIAMWVRIMRDRAARDLESGQAVPSAAERAQARTRTATQAPVGYRPYVMPTAAGLAAAANDAHGRDGTGPAGDPVDALRARYNAELAERSAGAAGAGGTAGG